MSGHGSGVLEFLERVNRNIGYWVAHLVMKEEAMVNQAISFIWLASMAMASIPFAQLLASGSMPEKLPHSIMAYSAFWLAVALAATALGISSITRFTDRMLRRVLGANMVGYEKASAYLGMLVGLLGGSLFALGYTVLPAFLGRGIASYIWLLGIFGILLGLGIGSNLIWRKTGLPGFREKGRVYLLSSALALVALILIHFAHLHYVVKGLCATASMILITLLYGALMRSYANRMLERVFGGPSLGAGAP